MQLIILAKYCDDGRWLKQAKLFWYLHHVDAVRDKDETERWEQRKQRKAICFMAQRSRAKQTLSSFGHALAFANAIAQLTEMLEDCEDSQILGLLRQCKEIPVHIFKLASRWLSEAKGFQIRRLGY